MGKPLIIFVSGMKPKPAPDEHKHALWRCLFEGLQRAAPDVASQLAANPGSFSRAQWTYAFYKTYRDISIDLPGIDALLRQAEPSDADVREASALSTRIRRAIYLALDAVPFIASRLANADMRVTLQDVHRYVTNDKGIADQVRADLEQRLIAAHDASRPVLLIGHSMGSVIAWDTLWRLSRELQHPLRVDLFMTLGSPLGNHVIQRGLQGSSSDAATRYPANIRRWVNLVAIGELTALDRRMQRDYAGMLEEGLVDAIEDYDVINHYRENGRLLVHSEYGYLVNHTTAGIIADWWRQHDSP
ncbi:MAG: hypothetical protein AAF004_11940 [Pseudomonadota bacterium]